mmetsp:Transcript_24252/g.79063  ORF Transcript_24252/g.79063 Transcript_24252/m.79063 type:complete len:204 (+) Transcript_24252:598-1209(+)
MHGSIRGDGGKAWGRAAARQLHALVLQLTVVAADEHGDYAADRRVVEAQHLRPLWKPGVPGVTADVVRVSVRAQLCHVFVHARERLAHHVRRGEDEERRAGDRGALCFRRRAVQRTQPVRALAQQRWHPLVRMGKGDGAAHTAADRHGEWGSGGGCSGAHEGERRARRGTWVRWGGEDRRRRRRRRRRRGGRFSARQRGRVKA